MTKTKCGHLNIIDTFQKCYLSGMFYCLFHLVLTQNEEEVIVGLNFYLQFAASVKNSES